MTMCDEMFVLLNLELDGELTPDEQKQLNAHRATCPACQARTFELRQLSEAVRDLDATPSEGFHDRVLTQIAQEQKTVKKVVPFATYVRRYGSLAACALVCIGLVQMGLHQKTETGAETILPMSVSETETPHTGDVMLREVQVEGDTATACEENVLLVDALPETMPEGVPAEDEWMISPDRAAHCYVSREAWFEMCDLLGVSSTEYETHPEGKYVIQLNENK